MRAPTCRAAVLTVALGFVLAGCTGGHARTATTSAPAGSAVPQGPAAPALALIERRLHARLGVYALDTGTGRTIAYRADERFAYCSTFKALAVGALLKQVTDGRLDSTVTYGSADRVANSPVTDQHIGNSMKLRDLMAAALEYSDNTAANLLLNQLGGPSGLQAAVRGLGDTTTHIDRTEPTLNAAVPGDIRDTSTPRALGTDLQRLVLADTLPAGRRKLLTDWLVNNTTGAPYIKTGLPAGWRVGDKTGSGRYGTRNDIAVAWPPGGSPVVIVVMSGRATVNATADDTLVPDAARAAIAALL